MMSCFVIIRCMESIDARKVPEGLYERRKQVVRLSKKGYGPMAVAELTGLSWGAVNAALKAYGAGGLEALRPKARGRKTGTKRLLSPEREAEVRKLICDKRPEQMKMRRCSPRWRITLRRRRSETKSPPLSTR